MLMTAVEGRTKRWNAVVVDRTDQRVSSLDDQRGEQRLLRRVQAGSRAAAAELFEMHWPAAHRAALAVTGRHAMADDVTQDAFERAFARIASFDAERPFTPWLHRIVVNRAIDLLRQEQRLTDIDTTPDELLAAWDADRTDDREALAALAHLSHDRRAVVVMRHLLGYHPPEIAEMLGIPLGTVNSRLARALNDLREHLEAGG
jgi:RNA polymerase sigma-70 factor, ECF subfamily